MYKTILGRYNQIYNPSCLFVAFAVVGMRCGRILGENA